VLDVLRLEPLLFPAGFTSHRLRILVEDLDVVAAAYPPDGFHGMPVAGFAPSWLLGPDGLAASPEAREVAVGGSDTTEDRLTVHLHQAGSEVVWDGWRLTDIGRELGTGLGTFRFDARAYAAELDRATARANRTWPARSVAENLRAVLWRDGYHQDGGAWIRGYVAIRAPEERQDVVEIGYQARAGGPGTYLVTFPVDGTDPETQAQVIVHRLGHEDLRPVSVHQRRKGTAAPEDIRSRRGRTGSAGDQG
jgi:hypothetical protein